MTLRKDTESLLLNIIQIEILVIRKLKKNSRKQQRLTKFFLMIRNVLSMISMALLALMEWAQVEVPAVILMHTLISVIFSVADLAIFSKTFLVAVAVQEVVMDVPMNLDRVPLFVMILKLILKMLFMEQRQKFVFLMK